MSAILLAMRVIRERSLNVCSPRFRQRYFHPLLATFDLYLLNRCKVELISSLINLSLVVLTGNKALFNVGHLRVYVNV